jgi:hypothetical protein
MTDQQFVCPKCGQIDMVQRVSAVYFSGISSGNVQGNTVGGAVASGEQTAIMDGTSKMIAASRTSPSRCLTPPTRPVLHTSSPTASLFIAVVGAYVTYVGLQAHSRLTLGAGLLYVMLGVVLILVAALKARGQTALFNSKVAIWEQAMQRWYWMRYCSRDEITFDPTSGRYAPVEYVIDLLYRDLEPAPTQSISMQPNSAVPGQTDRPGAAGATARHWRRFPDGRWEPR